MQLTVSSGRLVTRALIPRTQYSTYMMSVVSRDTNLVEIWGKRFPRSARYALLLSTTTLEGDGAKA